MSECLVFLGAGCSAEFGVPTMSELVEEFENSRDPEEAPGKSPDVELYRIVSTSLKNIYQRYDLETVLAVLDRLADKSSMTPFDSFVIGTLGKKNYPFSNENVSWVAEELSNELREFLKDKCEFDLESFEKNKSTFDGLWELMAKVDNNATSENRLGSNIYTTNYDRYLDRYLQEKYSSVNTSIVQDYFNRVTDPPFFDPRLDAVLENYDPNNEYVKIHGSIDWYHQPNRRIVKTVEMFTRNVRDVMMLPVSEKPLYLEPWITLLMLFKRAIKQAKKIIAIGYSFNDEYIRDLFKEVTSGGMHRMAVIGRSASKVVSEHFSKDPNVRGYDYTFADILNCSDEVADWLK